mmetsp:Transcript_8005/g.25696  ORF Transcript_8005/g.25696 Transcript_8005/m.25696 type:complete len:206 (+) Transcript_8005:1197-1814(+)
MSGGVCFACVEVSQKRRTSADSWAKSASYTLSGVGGERSRAGRSSRARERLSRHNHSASSTLSGALSARSAASARRQTARTTWGWLVESAAAIAASIHTRHTHNAPGVPRNALATSWKRSRKCAKSERVGRSPQRARSKRSLMHARLASCGWRIAPASQADRASCSAPSCAPSLPPSCRHARAASGSEASGKSPETSAAERAAAK